MMDRQGGQIVFECDTCNEVLKTEEQDFDEARKKLRSGGWKTQPIGKDWLHTCPDCNKKGAARGRR